MKEPDKSPGCFVLFPAGFDPATGCQVCRRKWRNKPPRPPRRHCGKLTRGRVLPTRSGLCSGGGRAVGNENVASIFHTLAARQEPHYPGFQRPGWPCYPQVLSIVLCHIIRPLLRLFIAAPTEFHDGFTLADMPPSNRLLQPSSGRTA